MSGSTADLSDELGEGLEYCETPLRNYGLRPAFGGTVSTVRCFEDIVLMRKVLSTPSPGNVLVVDGGGSMRVALFGDQMAQLAMDNGWAGLIINGAVRDSAALAGLRLGVKALGTAPRRGGRAGTGGCDVPVSFGGATFRPGDRVFSDGDGVVVQAGS